ncbi:MAG: hypothetical protein U5L11_08325 [Arhodomonas sp.]|nr:hypothetical protein [Arhodomonas sp.]
MVIAIRYQELVELPAVLPGDRCVDEGVAGVVGDLELDSRFAFPILRAVSAVFPQCRLVAAKAIVSRWASVDPDQ